MGAALATLKAMPNPRLLEGRTAATWLRRWMGRRSYETVWEPLLRGKFGDAAPEIAMPWFWARVHDRTQQLGYLRGGFQQLYYRLADAVRQAGGETRFGTAVTSVRTDGDALLVETDAGGRALRPRDLHARAAAHRAAGAGAARRPGAIATSGAGPTARIASCWRSIGR